MICQIDSFEGHDERRIPRQDRAFGKKIRHDRITESPPLLTFSPKTVSGVQHPVPGYCLTPETTPRIRSIPILDKSP